MADDLVLTRRQSERGVHETAQRPGVGAASVMARQYVGYEEWPESRFLRREVARHGVALILGFGDTLDVFEKEVGGPVQARGAFVVGNQSHSSVTGVGGHQLGVQVELTPAGALALFGAVEALNDAAIPLDEAIGAGGAKLVERLAGAPSWGERLRLLDEVLGGFDHVPALDPEVAWVRRRLLATNGGARVEPLMDETGWSRRHVTERFRRQLGLSPKAYARLLRFDHASSLLAEAGRKSLAEVAARAGYYDQSHLTRDFTALSGITPGAFAANAGLAPEVRFVQDAEGSPSA